MVQALILLALAVALILYALHELAPGRWPSVVGSLRGTVLAPPRPQVQRSPLRGDDHGATSALRSGALPAGQTGHDTAGRLLALWAPLAVIALALLLRVIDLTGSPFGFFCDEASNGLDAYGILHALHDQHGAFLPVYFEALEDWRGGFHIYWEVPFVAVFGLTELAVRLGSAIAGTLTVGLT